MECGSSAKLENYKQNGHLDLAGVFFNGEGTSSRIESMWNLFSDGQNSTTFGSLTGAGKGWKGPVHIEILIKGTCLKYMGVTVRSHCITSDDQTT